MGELESKLNPVVHAGERGAFPKGKHCRVQPVQLTPRDGGDACLWKQWGCFGNLAWQLIFPSELAPIPNTRILLLDNFKFKTCCVWGASCSIPERGDWGTVGCFLNLLWYFLGMAQLLTFTKELLGHSPHHWGSSASRLKREPSLCLCVFVLDEEGWNVISLKDIESGDKILIDKHN